MQQERKEEQRYDIFLSYSNHDSQFVEDLNFLLRHIGFNTWFDKQVLPKGMLTDEIKKGIDQSRFLGLVLSKNTEKSPWLELEARHFIQNKSNIEPLPLVFIKLSEGKPPLSIAEYDPRIIKCLDFQKSFIDAFVQIVGILQRNLSKNKTGILKYYPFRNQIPSRIWNLFYSRANSEIKLMGHSMVGAFQEDRDKDLILPALNNRQVKIRVLLLNPVDPKLDQLQEVQERLSRGVNLQKKILYTINKIKDLKKMLDDYGEKSKLQVRVTDRIIYSTVTIFDSVAFITSYSSRGDVGDNCPTFLVSSIEPDQETLFDFYNEEFENFWKIGIHPEEKIRKSEFDTSLRILKNKDEIFKIENWLENFPTQLPLPSMLIIYPTYKCSIKDKNSGEERYLCENCAYKELQSDKHIKYDTLSSILEQAIELGISNFEFTGGGEPLQYSNIMDLLELLQNKKKKNANLQFGLLTNGLHLNNSLIPSIYPIFSYIRFDYAEGILEDKDLEKLFIMNLRNFLEYFKKSSYNPRIGIKMLLNEQNRGYLLKKFIYLKKEFGDILFQRIKHFRIKAMRSLEESKFQPSNETSLIFRNDFFDYLFTSSRIFSDDIQVDLDLGFVSDTFKCRLAPLAAVVDPEGFLLPCCNYLNDHKNLTIGDLNSQKIRDLWGSEHHHKTMTGINPKTVCNAKNGCPCRFVKYQEIIDKYKYDIKYLPYDIKHTV